MKLDIEVIRSDLRPEVCLLKDAVRFPPIIFALYIHVRVSPLQIKVTLISSARSPLYMFSDDSNQTFEFE